MYRSLFSVGGFTLLSRVTGFARDMIISALLGATGLADAFFVAFKLPNLFRAVFGEGAFNTAYVPAYARILKTDGDAAARDFSGEVFAFLLVSQLALFAVFEIEAAHLVRLIAPGFAADPAKFAVTVALTRVTSPYLMLMTLAAQQSGTLNAHGKFAAAAFAPALLNFSMIGFLSAHRLFPDAAHAAAWGTLAAGFLQAGLVMIACARGGFGQTLRLPRFGGPLRRFFRALGPAVIGSAGVQIAIFADTIIASLLPTGSVSAINYADRLYQLPIGVIGVAAGVVLLPEMSKRLAVDDEAGAAAAQNRTLALSALLAAPFMVAFLFAPRALVDGVFRRGAFTAEDGLRAAAILRAYGFGLIAIVSIRSVVASFQARHDTRTPMLGSLAAIAANVALKL
ncbi:MAG: murein biosynthesis integral membrane protein MurJ, partial [Hyphomicrobiales bacterium]|nr:murein biosynthesis integral membrane protein MurJ [Hyphomicrobiales bacterium]